MNIFNRHRPIIPASALIVSRTKMKKGVCVGAIDLENGRFLRLKDEYGGNLLDDAKYQIRQIWSVVYKEPYNRRPLPHSEDVIVEKSYLQGELNEDITMLDFLITHNISVYKGDIKNIFENKLKMTDSGVCFIGRNNIPTQSVCFYITDKDIKLYRYYDKVRYHYKEGNNVFDYSIAYVGFQKPIDIIPKGSLLRMSLSNWFAKSDNDEEKCYLQLSGWYDIANKVEIK
jgi:hypothetical protein